MAVEHDVPEHLEPAGQDVLGGAWGLGVFIYTYGVFKQEVNPLRGPQGAEPASPFEGRICVH